MTANTGARRLRSARWAARHARPLLAVTGNVAPVSGTVLVKLPGPARFVPLSSLQQIPFGR